MSSFSYVRAFASCVALALATGCSSEGNDQAAFGIIKDRAGGLLNRGEAAVDPRAVLTPAILAQSPTPVLLAVFLETDAAFTLIPLGQTGDLVQWRDASAAGLFTRDGILVGSRGYGFDLWSAEVDELRAALRNGGGEDVVRVNRYLNGEYQIERRVFICSVVAQGRQTLNIYERIVETRAYTEACTGEGADFENRYWVGPDGTVVKSLEVVSPELGQIDLTEIVP